jgi:NitT/TauT family transport system permease protein
MTEPLKAGGRRDANDAGNDRVAKAGTPLLLRRGENTGHHLWTARAQWWLRLVSPLLLLGTWELLARVGELDARFFPPPSEIGKSAVSVIQDGSLWRASQDTLRRLALGYGAGALSGVIIGLWLGLSSWFRALIEPWIQITYPIPKLALYPLLVLVVGLGEMPIIVLLAIGVFYVVAINTIAGVLSIRRVIIDVGRDCRASFMQFFLTIALPASLPHIFTALEISLGLAYIILIGAEFVGAKSGLGAIIWSSWQLFDVGPMYVSIVTVSVLGYFSVLATRWLGDFLMPWRRTHG